MRPTNSSSVESRLIELSVYDEGSYPKAENIRTIVVENFPALGKASALRFLEWAQANPEGVCSLPTGKTPEYFIKCVQKILEEWESEEIQTLVKEYGLSSIKKPDLSNQTFVQIDEFFPISPHQHNSFFHYVMKYYIKGFGFNPKKCLLMDCSKIGLEEEGKNKNVGDLHGARYGLTGEPEDFQPLEGLIMDDIFPEGCVDLTLRMRDPQSRQEKVQQRVIRQVDQWCAEYEEKIRALGGIGFFMGGVGPDGHIAFNCKGCAHHSTARLDELNYKSQAAAAGDLGGIEAVKKRKIITIGLGTITYNKDCVAIICAAGEAKAKVVRQAVEGPKHVLYPATALHCLPKATFFITTGAAKLLSQRKLLRMQGLEASQVSEQILAETLINLSVKLHKRLVDLTEQDGQVCPYTKVLLKKCSRPLHELAIQVRDSLIAKIEFGTRTISDTRFLHTEPHHDDIMLGYLPSVLRHTRGVTNQHYFTCATSGFNSVSNNHMLTVIERCEKFLRTKTYCRLAEEGYFVVPLKPAPSADPCSKQSLDFRRRDVWKFLDGVAASDDELRDEGSARRFIANLCVIYGDVATEDGQAIWTRLETLRTYFNGQYAGEKDTEKVQLLKGSCREFEAECVWGHIGWQIPSVSHLRLGFYTNDIFAPEPTHERDVKPICALLEQIQPHVVSVALDPEASGPDTHYKVLQAVTAAVEKHVEEYGKKDMTIWGYRNVWFRFDPWEVSTIIPVTLQNIAVLNQMFLTSFESQRDAEFPAYEIQGPFCHMAQKVQIKQYNTLEICLGYQWFHNHPSPLIKATRGLVFLKEMNVVELVRESRALKKQTESV